MTTDHTPSSTSSRPDDALRFRYNALLADQIEMKWQAFWESQKTFVQPNPGEAGFDPHKPKFYCLDMFPYPSGAGLHVGHPEGYTATDIISRFKRMKGFNVLHPMGWDAFGLPAEQYAIQTGVHPAITTRKAINEFRRQLKRFGFSYDWSREVGTIDEDYYKWTQWIFLRLYNSWFDPQAESPAYPDGKTRRGCARPIADLIAQLESGDLRIGLDGDLVHVGAAASNPLVMVGGGGEAVGTRRWHELARDEQRAVIDNQRMAYLDEMTVNWCPALGTVLANDEVIDGKSERGGHPVLRKPLKQWQFRITAYAQRLLDDLALLDWPESTKTMQSEWIGRSEGAEIEFEISNFKFEDGTDTLRVFTTRPDTIFGATYMVVAPEHELVAAAINMNVGDTAALKTYVDATRAKSDVDRMADAKDKTGVFTGLYCINPATGKRIPIWTADYVLTGYGTGAIMAVPAHDERDFAFAEKFGLPTPLVVRPPSGYQEVSGFRVNIPVGSFTEHTYSLARSHEYGVETVGYDTGAHCYFVAFERQVDAQLFGDQALSDPAVSILNHMLLRLPGRCFTGDGLAMNSTSPEVTLDGLHTAEAKQRTIAWLEKTGRGVKRINFRLRDWVFSRQRYWGEPIPIVFDEHGNHYPLSADALPLKLPELADYSPVESDVPQPLLAKATQWMHTTAREAGISPDVLAPETRVTRETNTMPGSAGSSWYFLRYCDPKNSARFISESADDYWMGHAVGGIDLYIGGSEHAVGHLLYSRFWQKALFDLGEVSTPEPFQKLFHQGMITSFAYQRPDKSLVPCDQVDEPTEGAFIERATGTKLTQIVAKMSKSLKNVVNPDDIIGEFGADTFRLYEMYMGPLEASKPWNTKDTIGCFRFLQRAWRVAIDENTGELKLAAAANPAVEKQLHRMIAKVDQDVPRLAFNTAIAAMIEFVNTATASGGGGGVTRDQLNLFARTLAPFAPHMAEELWSKLGYTASIAAELFPVPDAKLLVDDEVEIPFSMNGKLKHKVVVPKAADAKMVEKLVMADAKVIELLQGKQIMKVIVVPGKMVNVVVGG